MHSPKEENQEAVYKIIKYMKSSPEKGLFFKKGQYKGLESFTDADWVGSTIYRRSTSEYYTFIRGNLVIRGSKEQNVVARSSVETEYRSMAHWIRNYPLLKKKESRDLIAN